MRAARLVLSISRTRPDQPHPTSIA
jgi:hypothetical protein